MGRWSRGLSAPLSLHPPHPGSQWQQGESLTFGLTLFNTLARDVEGIKSSLQRMGERGWGQQRIGFTLQEVTQRTPLGTRLIWSHQAPNHLSAPLATTLEEAILAAAALCSEATPALVQLHARTRLHIKEAGNPVTTAPSALLLGRTLCRRLLALVGPHSEHERQAVQSYLNGLEQITLCWDHTQSAPPDPVFRAPATTPQHRGAARALGLSRRYPAVDPLVGTGRVDPAWQQDQLRLWRHRMAAGVSPLIPPIGQRQQEG